MKYLLFLLLTLTTSTYAQTSDCYQLLVKGSMISKGSSHWKDVKVTGPKENLINFLRTDNLFGACNFIFQTPEQILNNAKKIDCKSDIILLEFTDPKDVLQLRKKLKEKYKPETKSNVTKEIDADNLDHSVEVCISSDGEISLSYSNKFGSIQVTSKGKFSISSKAKNGTEYKVEL